jgi:protein-L-isoaspartate(D-aspartate) O-methyltransferase
MTMIRPVDPFSIARARMVREQIEQRGVRDWRVLNAMLRVERHRFVGPDLAEFAYQDRPLPIGNGQTISQPYMVAVMSELMALNGQETVLEIGTGSGYQAAVLGELAREVHTVERHAALAEQARERLEQAGIRNVHVHVGDGSFGWPEAAPYQAVLVTAAAPRIPAPLIDQLAEGGRLVIPVGQKEGQTLERWQKRGGRVNREELFPVAFVPFRGAHGWHLEDWQEEET